MAPEILRPSPGRVKRQISGREHRFATICPPGLEDLCLAEAQSLGLKPLQDSVTEGVFEWLGKIDDLYKALQFCRVASRILVRLDSFHAGAREELFRKVRGIAWELWLSAAFSLRVDAHVEYSRISHEGMAAQTVEEAIRRRFADAGLTVQDGPPQRVVLRLVSNTAALSLDCCGEHLHRRGWRIFSGKAPLRENLAAGLLQAAGWPGKFSRLVDGMAGSGTFAIEACRMATGLSAAADRWFACAQWPAYSADSLAWWHRQTIAPAPQPPLIIANEIDPEILEQAQRNAQAAACEQGIQMVLGDWFALEPPGGPVGLLVLNPPYGLRLEDAGGALYQSIAKRLRAKWAGWQVLLLGPADQAVPSLDPYLVWTRQFRHGGLKISAWLLAIS